MSGVHNNSSPLGKLFCDEQLSDTDDLPHRGKVAEAVARTLKKFESPLSNKGLASRRIVSMRPRSLVMEDNPVERSVVSLDAIYGPEFQNPSSETSQIFRDVILEIEDLLKRHAVDEQEVNQLRIYIIALPFEKKYAELGLIHYYCERGSLGLGSYTSYIEKRTHEVEEELNALLELSEIDLPTGRPAYLLRAMVRLVLAESGKVRPCGAKAALTLLEGSLGVVLVDEHRHQICHCLTRLITHLPFRTLVNQRIDLSPQMEEIVRLELKLDRETKCTDYHVKMALLIALFSDLRQEPKDGNCYMIGVISGMLSWQPDSIFCELVHLLSRGTLQVGPQHLPLLPIFYQRLDQITSDLDLLNMDVESVADLPVVLAFCRISGIANPKILGMKEESLLQILQRLSANTPYKPEHVMSSFRTSVLLQLLVSAAQFHYINREPAFLNEPLKHSFFHLLKKSLSDALCLEIKDIKQQKFMKILLGYLHELWFSSFWLQDVASKAIVLEGSTAIIQYHDGYEARRKPVNPTFELSEFESVRHFFHIDHDTLTCVRTFADLSKIVSAQVESVLVSHPLVADRLTQKNKSLFSNCFTEAKCAAALPPMLARINSTTFTTLRQEDYASWQELLLGCHGGRPLALFDLQSPHRWPRRSNGVKLHFSSAKEFLEEVLFIYASSASESPWLIVSEDHFFMGAPQACAPLLKGVKSPSQLVQILEETVYAPLKELREKMLSTKDMEEIYAQFLSGLKPHRRELYESFIENNGAVSVASFIAVLLKQILEEDRGNFKTTIDYYLMGIDLKLYPLEMMIHEAVGTKVEKSLIEQIVFEISLELSLQDITRPLPRELAYHLRTSLASNGLGALDIDRIELAIYTTCKLPATVTVADLNWYHGKGFVEQPRHWMLAIKPDISSGELQAVKRSQLVQSPVSEILAFKTLATWDLYQLTRTS